MIIPTPIDEIIFNSVIPATGKANSVSKISLPKIQARLPLDSPATSKSIATSKGEIQWDKILIVFAVILVVGTSIYFIHKSRKKSLEKDNFQEEIRE